MRVERARMGHRPSFSTFPTLGPPHISPFSGPSSWSLRWGWTCPLHSRQLLPHSFPLLAIPPCSLSSRPHWVPSVLIP
jgi:hypothetical protein